MDPIIKWAGGKRRLLDVIKPLLPDSYGLYCEPFVGGGAVWLSVAPSKALISDANPSLVILYTCVRDSLEELLKGLREAPVDREYYYYMRDLKEDELDDVGRSVRFLYLNRTCFNGLYRVNSHGRFNVPYGAHPGVDTVQEEKLRALNRYLNEAWVDLVCADYHLVTSWLKEGDFVYLDPPYDPVSETSSFTAYTKEGFGRKQQIELRDWCTTLDQMGVMWMMSNSATDFIKSLYEGYNIQLVEARRSVSAEVAGRRSVSEVIVTNYPF